MRLTYLQTVVVSLALLAFNSCSCTKPPYKIDYENIGGIVIGKETCNADESQDYWLLDFTVRANSPQIGDTLFLNGMTYTNVLKVKGLDPRLKEVGMRVSLDYKVISSGKIITTNCTVASPVTYALKELFFINQFEIR